MAARLSLEGSVAGSGSRVIAEDEVTVCTESSDGERELEHEVLDSEEDEDEQRAMDTLAAMHGRLCAAAALHYM